MLEIYSSEATPQILSHFDLTQPTMPRAFNVLEGTVPSIPDMNKQTMTLDEYFEGQDESRRLFEAVRDMVNTIGTAEIRVTRSQVAFRRRKAFAWAWMPGKYLRGKSAPLVLTLALHHRDASQRWKEIVEPSPGRFTHHLELYSASDMDDEVRDWLKDAWKSAA